MKNKPKQSKQPKQKPSAKKAKPQKNGLNTKLMALSIQRPKTKPTSKTHISPVGISDCALKFAAAISNPWSELSLGVCIPTQPSRRSQKVAAFKRIIATVGTGGIGFVYVMPTIANNTVAYYFTDVNYTGTMNAGGFENSNLFGSEEVLQAGVQGGSLGNIPYSAGNFTGTIGDSYRPVSYGRIVSAGVSASYIGTTLNESGLILCYASPNHGDLSSMPFGTILEKAEADVKNFGRKKCWVSTSVISAAECEYDRSLQAFARREPTVAGLNQVDALIPIYYPWSPDGPLIGTGTGLTQGGAPLVIAFTGEAGSQVYVEIVFHLEYTGAVCEAISTPSHSDPIGFAKVLEAADHARTIQSSRGLSWSKAFSEGFKTVMRAGAPILLNSAVAALSAL